MKVKDLIHRLTEFPMDDEVQIAHFVNNQRFDSACQVVKRENNGKVYVAIESDLQLTTKVTFEE